MSNLVPRLYRVAVTEMKDPYNCFAVEGLGTWLPSDRLGFSKGARQHKTEKRT